MAIDFGCCWKLGYRKPISSTLRNLDGFGGPPLYLGDASSTWPWLTQSKKAASNTYERTFLKLVGQCGFLTNLSCRLHERPTSGPNWPVILKAFHVHVITISDHFWPWKNCRVATYGRKRKHQVVTPSGSSHGLWHHSQAMKEKSTYFKPAMTVFNHTTIYELYSIPAKFWWFNPVISQLPAPLSDLDLCPLANFWWTHLFSKPLAGRVVI